MERLTTYQTARLRIQPTTEDDASFMLELMNSPKWLQFIGDRNVRTEEEARKYIREKALPQFEKLGFGNYTVVKKSDGEKIGSCGLYDRTGIEGVDIGFAFLPQFEKMGYAYESARRILEAGILDFKLRSISAFTSKENIDSQKLLEKLGLHYDSCITLPNETEEVLLYKLVIGQA
jgi:RimJ/RimL family protein N-acetyltransferase